MNTRKKLLVLLDKTQRDIEAARDSASRMFALVEIMEQHLQEMVDLLDDGEKK